MSAYLVHQPKCNSLITNQCLIMTFRICDTLLQPPSICQCVHNVSHLPRFIALPMVKKNKWRLKLIIFIKTKTERMLQI